MSVRAIVARASVLALLLVLLPPVGHVAVSATPITLHEVIDDLRELPAGGVATASARGVSRSAPVEAPVTFNAVGVVGPEAVVRVRTSLDGTTWSRWETLEHLHEEDGPDAHTAEASGARVVDGGDEHATDLLWVGEARHVQVEVEGARVTDLAVTVIDSMGSSGGPVRRTVTAAPAAAHASDLDIVSRAQWGADESLRSGAPRYASQVHMGVVHHTAHASADRANAYSPDEVPGLIRAMYSYHTRSLGWSDIGYNVLIDRFGRVYEGRAGGFHRGVIGAHAAGYNTGSFGVSVIGNFVNELPPQPAIDALIQVIGVKSAIHGIDPTSTTDQMGPVLNPRPDSPPAAGEATGEAGPDGGLDGGAIPDGGSSPTEGTQDAVVYDELPPGQEVTPSALGDADGAEVLWQPIREARPTIVGHRDVGQTSCPGLIHGLLPTIRVAAAGVQVGPFPDVPESSPHRGAILALAAEGVVNGCAPNVYCPFGELTRAQASTFVVQALQLQPIPGSRFSDVPENATHASNINVLAENGWLIGYDDGTFRPGERMTRGQLATLLARSLGLPLDPPMSEAYPDVTGGHTHAPAITVLAERGVQGNCGGGNFCPDDVALRDSTASFVHMVRNLRQQ